MRDKQKFLRLFKALGLPYRNSRKRIFIPGKEMIFNSAGELVELRDYVSLKIFTGQGEIPLCEDNLNNKTSQDRALGDQTLVRSLLKRP